jgi:surface antigen
VPSNLGNAYSWYRAAQAAGLPTGLTPQVGAVMVNEAGDHVAVVEQVNSDGSFWISEMNSHGQVSMSNSTPTGGWGVRDYKVVGSVGNMKFIY